MASLLAKLRAVGRQVDKTVFVCSGELPLSKDTHVRVFYRDGPDGLGMISLPTTSSDPSIDQLVNACTPATFGKGTEEVLDKAYRDAVAMDASKFATSFQLSEYPQVLSEIQSILASDTEEDAVVRARLYKLNVYGKGGFFKAHRDTPRGDAQMFGTLVVCLPSPFEGGDFVVRSDDGFEQCCAWGPKSRSSIQWCAFYSDCEHEVMSVASGHRVTLTYLLESVPIPSLADSVAAHTVSSMEKTLREALADPNFAPYGAKLGFGLKHGYVVGDNNGAVPMLKGADRALRASLDRLGLQYAFVPVYASRSYDPVRFLKAQDRQQQGGDSRYDDDLGEYNQGRVEVTEFEMPGVEEPPPLDEEDPFYKGDGANHLLAGTWSGFNTVIGIASDDERCDGLDFDNLQLHTTREVLWIAPPVTFPLEKNGATYGNEPTMSSYYAAASIVAWVPSLAKRSQFIGEPKTKKTKRETRD